MSTNPFDDDNGSFFVLVNDEESRSLILVSGPAGITFTSILANTSPAQRRVMQTTIE